MAGTGIVAAAMDAASASATAAVLAGAAIARSLIDAAAGVASALMAGASVAAAAFTPAAGVATTGNLVGQATGQALDTTQALVLRAVTRAMSITAVRRLALRRRNRSIEVPDDT